MEDGHQSSVVFHTVSIKKNHSYGDDIHAAFTCNNYQPSGDDFVGVFDTESDSCNDVPFVCKSISSSDPSTVSLKIDFVLEDSLFELRYVSAEKQVLGKSAPFSITQSVDLQESLIEVHEGVSFDDNLVLIDKINPIISPFIAIADCPPGSEEALAERLVSSLSIFDDVGSDLDSPTTDAGPNDRPSPPQSVDPSDVDLEEDITDVVETSNVTETSSDKSISCNFLQEETKRRKIAESAVKVLSEALDRQTRFITKQTNDLIDSQLGCDKATCLNAELREENFVVQEQNETFESEMSDVRVVAQAYQLDCAKLKRQLRQDNELIDQLKIQILEDRQEHHDDMGELRDRSIEQIELLEQNSIRLEKELAKERTRFRNITSNYEAISTRSISPPASPPLSTSDHHTQTQTIENDGDFGITEQESVKVEKLEAKLKEQTEAHEAIIDRLEKDLRDEVESKTNISREYEKTIRELESRVVNESSNASRAENDLAVAENRFKEANNDIKYFRQQFIETEQKLQVNQRQLSKALEEVSLLRQALNTYINGGDTTDAMSALSDSDDFKSLLVESTCVSTSTSVDNFVPDRRRQAGDVTDYTDDESSNNWYYQSNNTHSYQHQQQQGGFDSLTIPSQPFHVNQEEGDINGAGFVYQQPLPAGLIPIRKTTDPESNEQHISVVETRRPPPRKQRRKYGKPIDLTPTSSLTNIAFSDRPNNSRDRQQMQQQFNKNIAEIDRPTLEKQYAAIRQHRNSLIRENNFLKNKCHRIKQDLLFTEKNLQNFSLEAEHKIAMLLMALNNQEYVSTQDLNSLLQMFPVPTSQQITYPQQQYPQDHQQPHQQQQQQQQQQQRQSMYLLESPNQSANSNNINNNDNTATMNGFLSPYAPEYQPSQMTSNPIAPSPMAANPMAAAYHDMMAAAAAVAGNGGNCDQQQMFIQQPNPTQPMDYQQFMDYQQQQQIIHSQQQQQQHGVEDIGVLDGGAADTNNYVMSVPSQLPDTPVPQEVIDASNQLAAIGVPISKTF